MGKEMKYIPQMEPLFGIEEKKALNDYMSKGGWVTEFKKTKEFENSIATFTGVKHCISVNNGTISLSLAALACDIKQGDEVIVPNYTMIATPNSIQMIGAKPIFVDVEAETLCLDIDLVKKAITSKTKAIILVSANGRYPISGIQAFMELCRKEELVLIEDSAQALGSFYTDGRHMGTVGDIGSFSFSTPKIISTGQGGCIITDRDDLAERVSRLKDFGRSRGGNDIHETIGYNFKFTDIQAVIGIEQMKKLPWRIERKKEILRQYKYHLNNIKQVKYFNQDLDCTTPWFIDVLVENRENMISHLKQNGIGCRVMYPPINKQRAYNLPGEYPVSELVGENGLWLPSSSRLTDKQVIKITELIKMFYG